jgi:hypothetical protein
MLEVLALFLSITKPALPAMPRLPPIVTAAAYRAPERLVDNWRTQAALDVNISPETALHWLAGDVPANLPRCVRLNNYWCIKKAGWAGEIAADAEGHVAFASAEEGAVVAVLLLRRYYLEYGRKSARAILARWAPVQCGTNLAGAGPGRPVASRRSQTPPQFALAKRGLGNTVRARWLAAHGRGGTMTARIASGRRVGSRSVAPERPGPTARTPTPAVAIGGAEPPIKLEPPLKTEPLRLASLSPPAPSNPFLAPSPSQPVAGCAGDNARLASYAARAIEGVAQSADDDLKLFAPEGTPLPPLPRLLANMASVEIGPYGADQKLIDAAIEAVRSTAWQKQGAKE